MMAPIWPILPGDLSSLAKLHQTCFVTGWGEKDLRELISSQGMFGYGAGQPNDPLGLILARVAADEIEIVTVCVAQSGRRHGIARRFIFVAAEKALAYGAAAMFLEVGSDNAAARGLYDKLGFAQVGQRKSYYKTSEGFEDGLILKATLPLSFDMGNPVKTL